MIQAVSRCPHSRSPAIFLNLHSKETYFEITSQGYDGAILNPEFPRPIKQWSDLYMYSTVIDGCPPYRIMTEQGFGHNPCLSWSDP